MPVRFGSARSSEKGTIDGKPGDQKGGAEVSIQTDYVHSKGWRVFRAIDPDAAEKIAQTCEAGCKTDLIGYSQYTRLQLWNALKEVGFNIKKLAKKVNTDCSSFVRTCCASAGIIMPDFITSDEPAKLKASGAFIELTGSKYTQKSDYLRRGDIKVTKTKGHTGIVLDNGPKAEPVTPIKPVEFGNRNLELGSEGADVKKLQALLIDWGYSCGKYGADGDFGKDTQSAVLAWQYHEGLVEDAVIDAIDYARIDKILNPVEEPEPSEEQPDDPDEPAYADEPEEAVKAFVTVTGGNTINVRAEPSATAAIRGIAYLGNSFVAVDNQETLDFYQIQFASGTAWISKKYTTLSEQPVVVEPEPDPVPIPTALPIFMIDTSEHDNNKANNWEKIKKNCNVVSMRTGVTRLKTKPLGIARDVEAEYVAKKCKEYDIPMSVYWYLNIPKDRGGLTKSQWAVKEAQKFYEWASPHKPIWYALDVEEDVLTDASIKAFHDELRRLGVKKVGLYIGHNYYSKYKAVVKLFDFVWIPRYGKNDGTIAGSIKPAYACDIWQYTSVAPCPGFKDNTLDINVIMPKSTKSFAYFTTHALE